MMDDYGNPIVASKHDELDRLVHRLRFILHDDQPGIVGDHAADAIDALREQLATEVRLHRADEVALDAARADLAELRTLVPDLQRLERQACEIINAPAQTPMSERQINELMPNVGRLRRAWLDFARAIERHHGIGK
jgi:hypothetical protein